MPRARLPVCLLLAALAAAPVAGEPDDASLAACTARLRKDLRAHPEVSPRAFDAAVRAASDLRPEIARASAAQPEFEVPVGDYLARRVDARRVADGRALMEREAAALDAVARRGVDPATTVAILGMESDYGRVVDTVPVVGATLARACLKLDSRQRRRDFFAALWLLQEGVVGRDEFMGSWAGAFGMTQFMPATYVHYMRDRAGEPPADILHSVPDALAATARYLGALGWRAGLPWGVEVTVPPALRGLAAAGEDHGCLREGEGGDRCRTVARWSALGVVRVDGAPLASGAPALDAATTGALLMPAGPEGPAWLVTPNFEAIWRYNRADAYALAIGLLSDALRGAPPQRVPWPTDDPGLSRAEFRELQSLLQAQGHDEIVADGAEGPLTHAAIRVEEVRRGWTPTGRAGSRMLAALRASAPGPEPEPASAPAPASETESEAEAASAPEEAASAPPPAASESSGGVWPRGA
jgi:lytic murein transglycosylase